MSDKIKQALGLYDEVTSIIGEERPTEPAFANQDAEGWWNVLGWEEKASQALADLLTVERRKNQKLQAENAEFKKQSQWISVEDELPEQGHYLFATKTIGVNSGFISTEALAYKKPEAHIGKSGRQFTHWMPLPTPPEGD